MKWLRYNIGKNAATLEVGYYWEVVKVIKNMLSREDNVKVISSDKPFTPVQEIQIEIIKIVPTFIKPFVISQDNRIEVINLAGTPIKEIVSQSYPFNTDPVVINLSYDLSPAENLELITPYIHSLQLWDKDINKEYEALKNEIEAYKGIRLRHPVVDVERYGYPSVMLTDKEINHD